jgi:hypothetical protein
MTIKEFIQYGIVAVFFSTMAAHAETQLSAAKTTQNPLGINPETRHIVVPFENYTNFGYAKNTTQNILDIKPIIPFAFTPRLDLVFKGVLPITHQASGNGYANGIGDFNPTLFVTPSRNQPLLWGIGPTVIMPTATNKALGEGKWSVGPELVLITMPKQWTFAILAYNVWSIAGESSRSSVNQFSLQYFITYNFPHGWYVTSQPILTADWFATPAQRWVVPFGAGVGRTMQLGTQTINCSVEGYYNAIKPGVNAPWTLQMNIALIFPDSATDSHFMKDKVNVDS